MTSQTARKDRHPRYHRLLTEFRGRTGVPVLLSTSFNDHGEPVNAPTEAGEDCYGRGIGVLAIEGCVVEKATAPVDESRERTPPPDPPIAARGAGPLRRGLLK